MNEVKDKFGSKREEIYDLKLGDIPIIEHRTHCQWQYENKYGTLSCECGAAHGKSASAYYTAENGQLTFHPRNYDLNVLGEAGVQA